MILYNFYKPLLIVLFEYYLYEAYPADMIGQLQENCLPFSAIEKFYGDFASGESARLNRTTLVEMYKRIMDVDPDENTEEPNVARSGQ